MGEVVSFAAGRQASALDAAKRELACATRQFRAAQADWGRSIAAFHDARRAERSCFRLYVVAQQRMHRAERTLRDVQQLPSPHPDIIPEE